MCSGLPRGRAARAARRKGFFIMCKASSGVGRIKLFWLAVLGVLHVR